MAGKIIGREKETAQLLRALKSEESEMISVVGRRRVGKTYLIREVYKDHLSFQLSGLQNGNKDKQLANFSQEMSTTFANWTAEDHPEDWLRAFFILSEYLDAHRKEGQRQVIFFDEVPWMATHKSDFLTGLSWFWNSWAERRQVVVVICGSAASWMVRKILRNQGGLHNRVTQRIRLYPFTLAETSAYLKNRRVRFSQYEILQLYMVMGGIPFYLKELLPGESVLQAIDRICFAREGLLNDEFNALYPALFENSEYHIRIIRALAGTQQGFTRTEILKAAKFPDGGRVSRVLEELIESGFITLYRTFGMKRKNVRYRLTDHYSSFYLRFIEPNQLEGEGSWMALGQTQAYKSWAGYAFENVCMEHLPQIKKALRIEGVYTSTGTFYKKGTAAKPGAQIDLLLDRHDGVINLIEMKFYAGPFKVSREYAERLAHKRDVLVAETKTLKRAAVVVIGANGVEESEAGREVLDNAFGGEVLFQ